MHLAYLQNYSDFASVRTVITVFFLISCIKSQCLAKAFLKDYFVGDRLELTCIYIQSLSNTRNVSYKFQSYEKSSFTRFYYANSLTYMDVNVRTKNGITKLHIASLKVNHSGQYDCLSTSIISSWKINVHDPENMVYVMTSRKQKEWEDTVISRFRIGLKWTSWTECDGCAGDGERRKYGFCYATWLENKVHCSDTKNIPLLLRTVAKSYREEIVVEICYDQCVRYKDPILAVEERVDVKNGDDVVLSCVKDVNILTAIRWEREGETLKRSDVSFGYAKNKPIFISKRNELILRKVDLPRGGTIILSCVEDRKRRIRFTLYVTANPDANHVTFSDHLFWVGLSSSAQIVTFLIILFVYISLENFKNFVMG